MRRHDRRAAAFVLLLLLLVGCSHKDGRLAASGTVALDGKPLESGAISFKPAPGKDGHGAGAPIENGQFQIPAGYGLEPGKYLVTVQTFKLTGRMVVIPLQGKVAERVLVKYNEANKLEATVAAGTANYFDFHLTTVAGGVR
jgi:hypothetical protein